MENVLKRIYCELKRRKIPLSKDRTLVGKGRTACFGIVKKRVYAPHYSRHCWTRPFLYKLLLEFGEQYITHEYSSIQINQNYECKPHVDKGNVGVSTVVAFGDYESGGQLYIMEGPLLGHHNIKNTPITADFTQYKHTVDPWSGGDRISIVYFTMKNARQDLHQPKFKEDSNGVCFFDFNKLDHPNIKKKLNF